MIIPRTTIIPHKYAATKSPNVDGIILLPYFLTIFFLDELIAR